MAENAQSLPAVVTSGIREFNGMPAGRQLALMGMAAGAVVVIVALLYWAMRPTYVPLFPRMDAEDAAEVVQVLSQAGIQYQVDSTTGQVKVPQGDVASARLQLASEGLPRSGDLGFELLQEDTGLGTSRMIEGARRHRAMEGELARTVASLDAVDWARVHIAEGEQSVFVRDRRPASASVVVHLRGGRSLSESQVGAIVHLVASSTSDLDPERVTVVDQRGRLLTQDGAEAGMGGSSDRLSFTRDVEQRYTDRIQDLLIPIVGRDRVRVQVNADIDFSRVERTEELYDPETIALRSEQTRDDERTGPDAGAGGVPGALTNQPPAGGVIGDDAADAENGAGQPAPLPGSRSSSVTRNFEVDRRINHIREMPGGVQRVSTAVVVDFRQEVNEDGESVQVARDAEELDRIEALVREAVGFNAARGDTINVVTAPFEAPAEEIMADEIAFWEQPWFLELVKIVAALLLALIILLTVVRPAMKQLMKRPEPPPRREDEREALTDESGGMAMGASGEGSAVAALTGPKGPDQQEMDLEAVREMVREDPKRVAQVMKTWLGEDGR
ncbi:flagellar basal-body MS-ring/collar protein FliF [Thioalkalivibrio sp. ALJ16]|uniref:flagellar basal-body MS-ring/collar protein FliF n=1 Tax=Thioalkalivibrio sp. ALJ16 TaxID=1158762 RepID=UPI00036F3BF7|nr:flagellar basal-body MS-ring/collar protein FliF [Thioalkalivibrio sp. ALJ16]